MAKTLAELVRPNLTAYEMAKEITKLGCYNGILEAHELVTQMSIEEITNMYNVGKIVEKYPKLWDKGV